uniref:Uncharacterized protein n=1 Tax=Pyrodinium bahamense TaxID=73915 RepID=A0A7S0FL21_9DINO
MANKVRHVAEKSALLTAESSCTHATTLRANGKGRPTIAAVAALPLAAGVLALASTRGEACPLANLSGSLALAQLGEAPDLCAALPYCRILGKSLRAVAGKGPDRDEDEGISFEARVYNTGLDVSELTLVMRAASEHGFARDVVETEEVVESRKPAWAKDIGRQNHFASVSIRPGANLTLSIRGVDPHTGESLVLPHAAITFFDIDAGRGRGVEFVKVRGYSDYWLTNSTELVVTRGASGDATFTASREGDGRDNPTDPLSLTALQKNRAVSVEFENADLMTFELGASEGQTLRQVKFVLRPALRCADTKLADGSALAADDPASPVTLMRSGLGVRGASPVTRMFGSVPMAQAYGPFVAVSLVLGVIALSGAVRCLRQRA